MTPGKRLVVIGGILAGLGGVAHGQGLGGLGGLGGTSGLGGLGGLGGAAAVPGIPTGVSGITGASGATGGTTLWSFLGLSKGNLAACKQKLCASQLGQMLNGGLTPLSAMTGGMLPTCCPTVPSPAQAAALAAAAGPTSAQAVAAKIQQDEAEAAARRAAVRYLATVDCHYWPEAEAALIGALRDDRNECVRYEAALALLNGCCCTAKTIEALKIVVDKSEKDGKPSETSERVRGVAMSALDGCLLRFHPPVPPIPLERPEQASVVVSAPIPVLSLPPTLRRVAYYYVNLRDVPPALIVAEARRAVDRYRASLAASPAPLLVTGKRSVYDALARASIPDPAPVPHVVRRPDMIPAAAPPPPLVPTPAAIPANRVAPSSTAPKVADARPSRGRNLRDIFLKSAGYQTSR